MTSQIPGRCSNEVCRRFRHESAPKAFADDIRPIHLFRDPTWRKVLILLKGTLLRPGSHMIA